VQRRSTREQLMGLRSIRRPACWVGAGRACGAAPGLQLCGCAGGRRADGRRCVSDCYIGYGCAGVPGGGMLSHPPVAVDCGAGHPHRPATCVAVLRAGRASLAVWAGLLGWAGLQTFLVMGATIYASSPHCRRCQFKSRGGPHLLLLLICARPGRVYSSPDALCATRTLRCCAACHTRTSTLAVTPQSWQHPGTSLGVWMGMTRRTVR
jgi:hypothetical protein